MSPRLSLRFAVLLVLPFLFASAHQARACGTAFGLACCGEAGAWENGTTGIVDINLPENASTDPMYVYVSLANLLPNTDYWVMVLTGRCSETSDVYMTLGSFHSTASGGTPYQTDFQLMITETQCSTLTSRIFEPPDYFTGPGVIIGTAPGVRSDCANIFWRGTPVHPMSWGSVKAIYR